MLFGFLRLPVLAILFVIAVSQSGWAQGDGIKALNQRIGKLYRQGDYRAAAKIADRALALAEKKFGTDHSHVATALNNRARLYVRLGQYAAAEPLYKRSLAIRQKAFGRRHHHVAMSLNNIARLYDRQGRYAEAEPLYQRSLAVFTEVHGKDHVQVGHSLNNLAVLYLRQGRYGESEPLFKRSLAIRENALGKDHQHVANSLNNLAELYKRQGRYIEAEPLHKRSLTIREAALGKDHPAVATTLNNLAALYMSQLRHAEAEPLYKRSLMIYESVLGKDHPGVAPPLNNLAVLYKRLGRFAESERLSKRSLAIREKALGQDHPHVGHTLNNLATLYERTGRYSKAERLHKRSLSIFVKAHGKHHPLVAHSLNNIARLYERQLRFAEAEPLYRRSLALYEKAVGSDHIFIANTLNNLAGLYYWQSDWQRATEYYRRGTAVVVRRTRRGTHASGQGLSGKKKSEAAELSFLFRHLVKSAHRVARREHRLSAKLARETFAAAQWATGSKAAASLSKMAARQATGTTQLAVLVRERQDLVDEWRRRDATRTAAVGRPPSKRNRQQELKNVSRLAQIDKRIVEIDLRLSSEFPDYASLSNPEPLTIDEVQDQLKPNEALVLFLDTPERKPLPEETFIWVVTKTASRWVRINLGTKALRDHVDSLRCGLDFEGAWKGSRCLDLLKTVYTEDDRNEGLPLPFGLKRAHKLYKALFGQIEDLIQDKELLIVPSGPLTQLPFQVLISEEPKRDALEQSAFRQAAWLAKRHAITVLPAVSALKSLRAHARASMAVKPFVGFGNPLLDGDVNDRWQQAAAKQARSIEGCAATDPAGSASLRVLRQAVAPTGRGKRLADPADIRAASALPETADELCAVARSAGADTFDVYLGARATETQIKTLSRDATLSRYKVVHFATHGTLAGELKSATEPGLILSPPANPSANDDGYLSASEVASLKLDADWVILSACNTAGGDATSAGALSGLARAFFYAGARSLLVSHWYVDSSATVRLITKAFDVLKRQPKLGRAGALREAMLELINHGERTWHPANWAPFVVVGEGSGGAVLRR